MQFQPSSPQKTSSEEVVGINFAISTRRSARLCTLRFQRHTHEKKNIDLEAKPIPSSPRTLEQAIHIALARPHLRILGLGSFYLDGSSVREMRSLPYGSVIALGAITLLDSDPGNGNDDVHALLLGSLPLVAVCAILLVVPEGADCAVHAAASVLLGLCGRANVLDYRAVGDVLVGGLRGSFRGGGLGCRCGLADESLQDGLLVWTLEEDLDEVRSRAWLRRSVSQSFAGSFCCHNRALPNRRCAKPPEVGFFYTGDQARTFDGASGAYGCAS